MTFKTHSSGLSECLFSSGYTQSQSFATSWTPYYDDRIHRAYASISNDKDLACLDDEKSILSEDGNSIVYATNSKISMTVPATLTNLVSFFQGVRLHYNDGQGTQDIVTFLGADFIDDMQLKCKI
jgi:hypothetical protein